MVPSVYSTFLILAVTSHVNTQFYDFFSALQQPMGHQTINPIYQFNVTPKRTRPQTKTTTKRPTSFSFYSDDSDRDKQKTKNAPLIYDVYSTTTKPSRTTKSNPSRRHYNTNNKETTTNNNNRSINRPKNTSRGNTPNKSNRPTQLQSNRNINNDRLIFDDGSRNTVINYETTRPNYYTTKPYNYETTRKPPYNPYTVQPGVKPAVVSGPVITNRPPVQRPVSRPTQTNEDDLSVSPELMLGPNEDNMSTVEKKRYIEMAEKMCDKYKALDVEQIAAIPLLPSPYPVKVNVSKCAPSGVTLVVGGKVVSIEEFRHMALLGWNNLEYGGYSWKCGGSLVSNQYVLTAAHCAYQDRDNTVVTGTPRAVQLGSSYVDGPGAVVVKVAAVIRHPKYKLPKSYYDIALIKLTRTVPFSNVIKPACIGIPPAPGQPVIATGWGRTEFGGDQSKELRSVSIPIWDMTECYNVLGTSRKLPNGPSSDSQVCAGEKKGGKDTCQGDSGGPAQIQDGCSWRVVAVTSLGRSCGAPQTPALYARVPRAFISAVIFGGQITNNNNRQTQQSSNQAWNNQQSNPPQWTQQQTTTQRTTKNPQHWDNNQQNWNNNQQQSNNQNWDSNQQASDRNPQYWNRNQEATTKNTLSNNNQWNYNTQQSNNQQWNSNQRDRKQQSTEQSSYNQQWNQQNNQHNRNQQNGQQTTEYNTQQSSYNQHNRNQQNGQQTTEYNNNRNNNHKRNNQNNGYSEDSKNVYQTSNQNYDYYNQNNGQNYNRDVNSGYTTQRPYNSQSGYYSDDNSDERSSEYGSDGGRSYKSDSALWWT